MEAEGSSYVSMAFTDQARCTPFTSLIALIVSQIKAGSQVDRCFQNKHRYISSAIKQSFRDSAVKALPFPLMHLAALAVLLTTTTLTRFVETRDFLQITTEGMHRDLHKATVFATKQQITAWFF